VPQIWARLALSAAFDMTACRGCRSSDLASWSCTCCCAHLNAV
jgi:hypothetical protein